MGSSNNHILVPIDFSAQSIVALDQSYNLARLTKADITLIHVIEETFHLPFFSKKENSSVEKKIKKELEKLAAETMQKVSIHVNTIICKGKVYEEIQKAARKLKSSFIVMGTNGTSAGLKKFIGSNALRVVREAPCPVITIKGKKHRFGCKNIVLPLDLTKETREKVNKSIEIAQLFSSTIHLVTILTTDDEFIVKKLHLQMKQVHDFISQKDILCTEEFINSDDIPSAILNYSKKIKADLLMIMTREENWTDLMFISSSAQQIINSSDIPVLSIRPKEKKTSNISVYEY
jgi:nucleotide-binding universal stress UspA family protein